VTESFAKVIEGRGPRAVERLLLAEVERLAPRSIDDLGLPLRIVVPSASLRLHLEKVLVRELGALAGVIVQSLFRVAAEILERAGETAPVGDAAFEIVVRRIAATEPKLRSELAEMEDGYAAVSAAVRDLLDAGLGRVQTEAVLEKLDELGNRLAPGRLDRARAVVRVAERVGNELDRLGLVRRAGAPGRAADLLLDQGRELLPARAVLVVGFTDATGVAVELVQALMSRIGGVLLLDRPPDPVESARDDAGVLFLERLASHFSGLDRTRNEDSPEPPVVTGLQAPNVDAEIRGVAHRIRHLLDDGVEPESIGVVARDIDYLATRVRRHFPRLAIPFSGGGSTVAGGAVQRRARLLAVLLAAGVDAPAEQWLESLASPDSDLLLALRTVGVVRLLEVAELNIERRFPNGIALPIPVAADEDHGHRHRRLPVAQAAAAQRAAARLVKVLRGWPARAVAADHLRSCRHLLAALGWDDDSEVRAEVGEALGLLAAELPPDESLTLDEWLLVLTRSLERLGSHPLGGAGGGVQVLSAIEARARTFEHLFVVGLNRGVFPRVVEDDPMLPDQARGHLSSDVLPDTPVKARGLDEERYLFAQLVASAPHVTLCWGASSDAARRAPSAFVERYRRDRGLQVIPAPDPTRPSGDEDPYVPRPAVEHAVLAAQSVGGRTGLLRPFLELAIREGQSRAGTAAAVASDAAAAARLDVLAETDPPKGTTTPGPWAGMVAPADPGELPWVTGFEGIATCPFQTFVRRRLGVQPMPDPRLGLPETRGLLVGELVHAVLQRIVEEATGRRGLEVWEVLEIEPIAAPWPQDDVLGSWLKEAAVRIVRRHGLAAWGLEPLLVARARKCLEEARKVDWTDDTAEHVLGAEVTGEATVAGLEVPVRFRADRVDRGPDGLELVDYKTGKPISTARTEKTHRKHFVQRVGRGGALQPVAYALGSPGVAATGRYLFVDPDIGMATEEARDVRVRDNEADITGVFANAVVAIATAWHEGACFPRVVEPGDDKTPTHCSWCDVSEACRRDDSDYTRRIRGWVDAAGEGTTARERATLGLWWLGRRPPEEDR
jgi:hypothetical protein